MTATGRADGGLTLTLLNGDSSWKIEVDGTRLLLDPWLEGPAIVGVKALHVARLGTPAVKLEEVLPVDALLVSHPFPDHCNATTLRQLPRDLPAFAPRVVRPFLKAIGRFRKVGEIPNLTRGGAPLVVGNADVAWFRAAAPLDTTHNALVVRGRRSGATVMYCPHAVLLQGPTIEAVERYLGGRLDALLCSFTLLDLPGYLGGVANLGKEAAVALVERLAPRHVLATHDGEKPDSGFIARVEKITRHPDIVSALSGRAPSSRPVVPVTGEPLPLVPAA